jgi:hypothetical protein
LVDVENNEALHPVFYDFCGILRQNRANYRFNFPEIFTFGKVRTIETDISKRLKVPSAVRFAFDGNKFRGIFSQFQTLTI